MHFTQRLAVSMDESDPCPCESVTPPMSPGPVGDQETVIRFVQIKDHVGQDESGRYFLRPTAITREELSGRRSHSFSLVREAHIEISDLRVRAVARTKCDEWNANPVLARVQTKRLRGLVDGNLRREICVNSDPTTADDDRFGACPAHAAALRSDPPLGDKQRAEWIILRTRMGECFDDIRHFDGSTISIDAPD